MVLLPALFALVTHLSRVYGTLEPQDAAAHQYTIVKGWNAFQIPPDRHAPTAAGPMTHASTLEACEGHCTATNGCVQFAWNNGSATTLCFVSSAAAWSGYGNHHITSGCFTGARDLGTSGLIPTYGTIYPVYD
jgi:hypothetical protein